MHCLFQELSSSKGNIGSDIILSLMKVSVILKTVKLNLKIGQLYMIFKIDGHKYQ